MSTPSSFPPTNTRDPYDSRDTGLDDTIESSFPASDPPSTMPDPTRVTDTSHASDDASRSGTYLWAAIGALLLLGVCTLLVRPSGSGRYDRA